MRITRRAVKDFTSTQGGNRARSCGRKERRQRIKQRRRAVLGKEELLRLCHRLLEQQLHAHAVRIMQVNGRAIPALLGPFADVDPGPLQVRNDVVKG